MKQHFIMLLLLIWGGVSASAQEWTWEGETPVAGSWYLYNVETQSFFTSTNGVSQTTTDVSKARLVTITDASNTSFKFTEGTQTYYMYHDSGTNKASTSEPSFKFLTAKQGLGYIIYTYKKENNNDRNRHLKADGSNNNCSFPKDNYSNDTWLFISQSQYSRRFYYRATNGNPADFTSRINNPTIIQNGAQNTMPNGWTMFKHGSGNGNFTEGTGDTRLECWHWDPAVFDVDYYQTLSDLPAGHYVLSADMHFRGTENSVGLYVFNNETKTQEYTLVNINDETDRTYTVEFDIKQGESVNIGIKKINANTADNAWVTADNFTLKYYGAFNDSELKAYAAWEAQQGNGPAACPADNSYTETFNNNYNFTNNKVIYKVENDLPAGYYCVSFYAVTNHANHDWCKDVKSGDGIAQVYANASTVDVTVTASTVLNQNEYTIISHVGNDGILEYGVKNIAEGGNWYAVKDKSLTYLGESLSESRKTATGFCGTICLPYKFEAAGANVYTASVDKNSVILTELNGDIQAGVPYIYQATADDQTFTSVVDATVVGQPVAGARLTGIFTDTKVPVGDYVMQTKTVEGQKVQKFYKVVSSQPTLSKYKAYLHVDGAQAREFSFGEETAIEAVEALVSGKAEIYDLNGCRRAALQKGINIVNGVKILVK